MKTLFFPGQRGGPFGWGVFGQNMAVELARYFELTDDPTIADVSLIPIADHNLTPITSPLSRIKLGMCFFEYPLGDEAKTNAEEFDTLFCGSTWNLDRLWERGISNAKVLIQGVDHSIFNPRERPLMRDGFRIFSGGKFEWRKGQDLVIAAFAEFAKTHPDAHLVCSWFNPWGQLALSALCHPEFAAKVPIREIGKCSQWEEAWTILLEANGIPRDRFTILPQLDQPSLAAAMRNTDVGLFPNRCEGGTNLVLMEYAACGKRVVANTCTGHADVKDLIGIRIPAGEDENHWADQSLGNIRAALDVAYANRHVPDEMSALSAQRNAAQNYTWASAAATVAEEVERIAGSK